MMIMRENTTSRMSQLLKLSQRQQSQGLEVLNARLAEETFLGFAQKAFNHVSIANKMNRG